MTKAVATLSTIATVGFLLLPGPVPEASLMAHFLVAERNSQC